MSKKTKEKKLKKVYLTKNQITQIRMRRFFALIIDWYLSSMIFSIPITFYLQKGKILTAEMFNLASYPMTVGLLLGLFGILVGFIYHVIIPTYVWKGQTIGKKLCKIKVCDEYGQDVSFQTLFKREMLVATILEGGLIISGTYLRKLLFVFGFQTYYKPVMYLAYAITIASIGYAYFNPLSQSFHDRIAKTTVINK